jgi:hypothetical protein
MRKSGACLADMQKAIKKAMQNNAWLFHSLRERRQNGGSA